jgi:uncharacterized membrane protein YkvA (DUF1232 family)
MTEYEETARRATRYEPEKFERDRVRVEHGFWDKVRTTLGRISFVEDAVAAYYCAIDPDTPLQVKAILMGALAYFIMPVDVVPDFLAMFGFFDDAAVLAAAYRKVSEYVQPHHRTRAQQAMADLRGESDAA